MMEGLKAIPLPNLCSAQIGKVLAKLQLTSPTNYKSEDKLKLLRCSMVFYKYLSEYEDENIFALFDNSGQFMDFKTVDGEVTGIFAKSGSHLLYPCNVCAAEVTDKQDSSGFGLHCNGCDAYFHNQCNEKPVSPQLYECLKNSPNYVRVYCPGCIYILSDVSTTLKVIDNRTQEMSTKVKSIAKKADEKKSQKSLYSDKAAMKTKQNLPNQVINTLKALTKEKEAENLKEKQERSRIVLRPSNNKLTNSQEIRKEFNKIFKGIIIRNCRTTAGGSILLELDDKLSAQTIDAKWSDTFFGGNCGIKIAGQSNTCGIIKHVYDDDLSLDKIRDKIKEKYTDADCEFFTRTKGEEKVFTGIVKIDFKNRSVLENALKNRIIQINSQNYVLEEYQRKPQVIKCNKCQAFGHVHRLCRSPKPKCGKCCSNDHETKTCSITESNFKCAHCNENHLTGSKTCTVFKKKLDELLSRNNYDM